MNARLRERHRHPVHFDKMVATHIVGLHLPRGPIAVRRVVVPVCISALQRQIHRSRPHVGTEVFKRRPSFAQLDASSSIIHPLFHVGVGASTFHGGPDAVLSCSCLTVSCVARAGSFRVEAAATHDISSAKVVESLNCFGSAIARALPVAVFRISAADNRCHKPTKSNPRNVVRFSHDV